MATLEPTRWISYDEYDILRAQALPRTELVERSVYAFAASSTIKKLGGVVMPAWVELSKVADDSRVKVVVLDQDLRPTLRALGTMSYDLWTPSSPSSLKLKTFKGSGEVKEGFLTGYNEGLGMPDIDLFIANEMPKSEQLVGV